MSGEGWISLHRKIQQSFVWTNSDQLKLWLYCLMQASHKKHKFPFNGEDVNLQEGEFVTGVNTLEFDFNKGVSPSKRVSGRTLFRWLHLFNDRQMLSITSNTKYSVVSITNWHDYQDVVKPLSQQRHGDVTNLSTYNNGNKGNKKDSTSSGNDGASKVEQNFELLWKLYPRKEGKDVARKAYKRAIKNGTTNKEIQDGIVAYRKLVASEGRDKQYIRQGGTWFNQKGWEDEYQTELPVDTSEQSEQSATDMNDLDKQQEENLRRAEEKYKKEHPELNE